jgi:hypothetical protein
MIAQIINAITQELKQFSKDNEAMIIFDTELKNDMSFNLPLIVLECTETPESARLPGNGITRMDWRFTIRCYTTEPDAYIDDETTGSTGHLNFSDDVRNYFEDEIWESTLMLNVASTYGLRLTYSGTSQAPELTTEDKTYKGYSHSFETISFDQGIISTEDMTDQSQTVVGSVEFE